MVCAEPFPFCMAMNGNVHVVIHDCTFIIMLFTSTLLSYSALHAVNTINMVCAEPFPSSWPQ